MPDSKPESKKAKAPKPAPRPTLGDHIPSLGPMEQLALKSAAARGLVDLNAKMSLKAAYELAGRAYKGNKYKLAPVPGAPDTVED